jgi:D-aminoacyl-tRNA deacylase
MNIAIICSTKDPASINIKDHLVPSFNKSLDKLNNYPIYFKKNGVNLLSIYTFDIEPIHCENIDKKIDADIFIFATKHQSRAGVPSLSVHSIGNFSSAQLGGINKKLVLSPASFLKSAFLELSKFDKSNFPSLKENPDIIQEVTHHGPFLNSPTFFIEIGSSLNQWVNPVYGMFIAETILKFTKTVPKYVAIVGIGGLHHTPNFKKVLLNSDFAISHVCPKYSLEHLDGNLLDQMIHQTVEKVEFVVLDWKGLGKFKGKVSELMDKIDLPVKRIKDF